MVRAPQTDGPVQVSKLQLSPLAILPESSPPRWRPKTLSCFIFESTTPLGGYYSESKSVNSCQLSKQLSACSTEEPSACPLCRAMSKDSARSYFFQPRCCSKLQLSDATIDETRCCSKVYAQTTSILSFLTPVTMMSLSSVAKWPVQQAVVASHVAAESYHEGYKRTQ